MDLSLIKWILQKLQVKRICHFNNESFDDVWRCNKESKENKIVKLLDLNQQILTL
jgi:hypothetical protein